MNNNAPRSVEEYLRSLRAALEDQDPALIQDALYDAEEYLRAEVAAHADKSEADVLELIASTYGAPEEVAAAYRDTEIKVAAALRAPPKPRSSSAIGRFFGVFSDARAYAGLLFMLFSLAPASSISRSPWSEFRCRSASPCSSSAFLFPRVHRRDARAGAGGMPPGRKLQRRAHAAPPAASGRADEFLGPRCRHADGYAHRGRHLPTTC
jgi:hypothetical protein